MTSEAGTTHPGRIESKSDICAIVVTCNPDAGFPDRLARVSPQVGHVVVVDNGSDSPVREMLRNLAVRSGVELILNDSNLGVATALNQGAGYARDLSFRWALTLDQDSVAEPDLVEALHKAYNSYPSGEKVAAVGSNYFDERRRKALVADSRGEPPFLERTTVITSGTLVSLDAYERVGPFRDDFFIDHVDDEYCLRTRSKGYKVILCRKPVIRHSIGGAIGKRIVGRTVWSSNHSAARRYYMARNFTVLARQYLFSEPGWILQTFLRHLGFVALMLFLEDQRARKLHGMFKGLGDGLRGKMGMIPKKESQ